MKSKQINKIILLTFITTLVSSNLDAQKIVYKEKKNHFYNEYGISSSWCFECSINIGDMAGRGTKTCTLQPTNGKQWPSGIYKAKDGPKIVLIAKPGSDIEINVKNQFIDAKTGDKITINVGGEVFMKNGGPFGSEDTWVNEEARKIIELFKKENSAKMIYESKSGKKHSQNYSLSGFTKAIEYSEKFIKKD